MASKTEPRKLVLSDEGWEVFRSLEEQLKIANEKLEKIEINRQRKNKAKREYYAKNKDYILQEEKKTLATPEGKEKRAIAQKKYRDANKEKIAATDAARYQRRKEELAELRALKETIE